MKLLLIHMFIVLNMASSFQSEIPEAYERRIEKALKPVFKTENFYFESVEKIEHTQLFKVNADSVFSGYLALTSSKGRMDRFEYIIVYNPDISIRMVKVIQYNSSRGTEVTSKRWLKQFIGNGGENLKYGKDIQAISGATYSATSITEDIPIVTQWVKEVVQ